KSFWKEGISEKFYWLFLWPKFAINVDNNNHYRNEILIDSIDRSIDDFYRAKKITSTANRASIPYFERSRSLVVISTALPS
ncbi:hypothetical protein DERP_007868, partial [Dermatophagoides pteronyssinus]